VSRAFVKENDAAAEDLPERPISAHPNLVTSAGLALIEAEVERLLRERADAQAADDQTVLTRIARDLRYWNARLASAQVVPPPHGADAVRFGSSVTIARDGGRVQSYRIVGEDEADPAKGTLSYVSPLARALIGKKPGDVVRVGKSEAEITEIRTSK
jgi:transcription elongation GreA/GreB family factor